MNPVSGGLAVAGHYRRVLKLLLYFMLFHLGLTSFFSSVHFNVAIPAAWLPIYDRKQQITRIAQLKHREIRFGNRLPG